MKNTEIIAIVLRHTEYLPEALRIGRHFCQAGMKVSIMPEKATVHAMVEEIIDWVEKRKDK